MNTLASADDLYGLPGAPFDSMAVDIAVSQIRAAVDWHIAPVITETITLESRGGHLLVLPSRRVVSVSAVRYIGETTQPLVGWRRTKGGLFHRGWWPMGLLEIDMTHGFTETPQDLLPVIAEYARNVVNPRDPSLVLHTVGQVTQTYRNTEALNSLHPALARYAIPGGVA